MIYPKKAFFLLLMAGLLPYFALAQDALNQPRASLETAYFVNMSQAAWQNKINQFKEKGYYPSDVEIEVKDGKRLYHAVFKEKKGLKWKADTRLKNDEFSAKWEQNRKEGYRLIDQESYRLDGVQYYAGIWIKNDGRKWGSYRNLSSDQYKGHRETMKKNNYIMVDFEGYTTNEGLRYSFIMVENKENIEWANLRNVTEENYDTRFKEYLDRGFRLYDWDTYINGGNRQYSFIWVKEKNQRKWKSKRKMSAFSLYNRNNEYFDMGYRIKDIEVYGTGKNKLYAAVWVEDNVRARWSKRSKITELSQTMFDNNTPVGMSVSVAINGEIVYLRGFGFSNRETGAKAHSGTIFRLASISKAISGVLGFKLQEQGVINLSNDETNAIENRYSAEHDHKLEHLLTCRSGVVHYPQVPNSVELDVFPPHFDDAYSGTEFFKDLDLRFTPGSGYLYSTHGYSMFAAAIEKKLNQTYPIILTRRLQRFKYYPSLSCEVLTAPKPDERSKIYDNNSSRTILTRDDLSWKYAGGGMESSPYDLTKFGIRLLNDEIISNTSYTTMTTPKSTAAQTGRRPYAYGWDVYTNYVAKQGDQPGAASVLLCDKSRKIVITVLCNTRIGSTNARVLANAIYNEL